MLEKYLNKIICADSLDVMKKLPNESIDLILTDPPYGMSFQSKFREKKYEKILNDNYIEWFPEYLSEMFRILKDNRDAYIFCSFHNVDKFKAYIEDHLKVANILIWVKNNTGMGNLYCDYAPQYEMIIYIKKGKRILNHGRDSNVLRFKRTFNDHHPTEKPLNLLKYLIKKSCEEGYIVLDPFSGSGTTAIACKEMGMNYICIEKEKKYCNVSEKRLKLFDSQLTLY